MFGGLTFSVAGHMSCGSLYNDLAVRVGPGRYQPALAHPDTRPMGFTSKSLPGLLYVGLAGCKTGNQLKARVDEALHIVLNMPSRSPRTAGSAERQP